MDRIAFVIPFLNLEIYWYGIFMVTGIFIGIIITTFEVRRRGENPDYVQDGALWVVLAGIVGARIWYVLNAILGGSAYYLENPLEIFALRDGGLHFYGAVFFGLLAAYFYVRVHQIDIWLVADAAAPVSSHLRLRADLEFYGGGFIAFPFPPLRQENTPRHDIPGLVVFGRRGTVLDRVVPAGPAPYPRDCYQLLEGRGRVDGGGGRGLAVGQVPGHKGAVSLCRA